MLVPAPPPEPIAIIMHTYPHCTRSHIVRTKTRTREWAGMKITGNLVLSSTTVHRTPNTVLERPKRKYTNVRHAQFQICRINKMEILAFYRFEVSERNRPAPRATRKRLAATVYPHSTYGKVEIHLQ